MNIPDIDLFSIQTELDNRWTEFYTIFHLPTEELEYASIALADDIVFDALFSKEIELPEPTHALGKRHRYRHTSEATKDDSHTYAPHVCFTRSVSVYFLYIGDDYTIFYWGGKN